MFLLSDSEMKLVVKTKIFKVKVRMLNSENNEIKNNSEINITIFLKFICKQLY